MLASELRRRRVRPRSVADSVQVVQRQTWIAGDLKAAPTSLLVLAALTLTTAEEGGPERSSALR
jgi:hypothetical protein